MIQLQKTNLFLEEQSYLEWKDKWDNRNTRFLKPLSTDEVLKIKFTVSSKEDIDDENGKIAIDYEGTDQNGNLVVVSKKNLYRIKKEPPRNR